MVQTYGAPFVFFGESFLGLEKYFLKEENKNKLRLGGFWTIFLKLLHEGLNKH
jgi:hypothetical protein